ncbi:hypothetical protein LZ554_003484 [Drepanopeziza brunnea f. sp. 'monogermtubi']|nr:hypothetical protein LZ554_003484 [Drepanopeziza brunnea f. sp. 'monogermtubi']
MYYLRLPLHMRDETGDSDESVKDKWVIVHYRYTLEAENQEEAAVEGADIVHQQAQDAADQDEAADVQEEFAKKWQRLLPRSGSLIRVEGPRSGS